MDKKRLHELLRKVIGGGLSEKEVEEYYLLLNLNFSPNVLASKYSSGVIGNPMLKKKK